MELTENREVRSSIHFPGRMKIVVKTASQSEWRSTAPALGKGVICHGHLTEAALEQPSYGSQPVLKMPSPSNCHLSRVKVFAVLHMAAIEVFRVG